MSERTSPELAEAEDLFWQEIKAGRGLAAEILQLARTLTSSIGPVADDALALRVRAALSIKDLADTLSATNCRARDRAAVIRRLRTASPTNPPRRWAPIGDGIAVTFTVGTCRRCGGPVILTRSAWSTIDGQPAVDAFRLRAASLGLARWEGALPPNEMLGGCSGCVGEA